MFNSEKGKRKLALGITHYVYRDTKIEDFHSSNIIMDKKFYWTIYKMLADKLKRVKLLNRYVYGMEEKRCELEEFKEYLNTLPEELQLKFIKYFMEVAKPCGYDWDDAEEVEINLENNNLAKYILSGEFLKHCEQNKELDDCAMKKINIDIHNRIYSLLVKGFFD